MKILDKIQRGTITRHQKVVIYGPEAVGKTTLAAALPAPLFLDTEGGTAQLDVARLVVRSWTEIMDAVRALARDPGEYRTIVVDTVDWAERLATEHVVRAANKSSIRGIEDFGFGKGWVFLAEEVARFLAALDAVPMHRVLVAHSRVVRFEPPDLAAGYDRYELKLSKSVLPLVKEWADALLFAQWDQRVRESESGRAKGVGGKERYLYTVHSAAFDAKNRHGLAERVPMSAEAISVLFPAIGPVTAAPTTEPNAHEQFGRIIAGHEPAVLAFLVARGVLAGEQGLDALPADYIGRAVRRSDEFLAAVNDHAANGNGGAA